MNRTKYSRAELGMLLGIVLGAAFATVMLPLLLAL